MTKPIIYLWPIFLALAIILGSCEPAYPTEVNEIVLQTISMESANQPFSGQVAVASVIINRARKAGKSLEWVVLRPRQFSCWNENDPNRSLVQQKDLEKDQAMHIYC